ncbi:ATP-binding protein [Paraburkholderia caledonica]|uniref:ATP-binding protein n=1 Tax=Paraburkholderia caledonica TaxID=134536 RepID=UPI00048988DA|nr:ATP-binding protein [Paraburkholderia caledonica]
MSTTLKPGNTLALKVANTGFMLDRLGMDCDDLQFLRELTKNSIEAIQRLSDTKGEIVWDVDWLNHELLGVYRLSITDTGTGMDGEEMVKYINQLSSSSVIQSHVTNYGVGAKISAATRNPAGLQYISWKNGVGTIINLWKDPKTGEYGLQQMVRPDGTFGYWAYLTDEAKPNQVGTHGTKVVLMGRSEDHNTMDAPPGAPSPSRWVTRYLNTRFYDIPEGITIKAREGWTFDRSDKDRNLLRTITGQKRYLDGHATYKGSLSLQSAVAYWWILKQEPALTQNSGFIASSGHTAALWQGELYESTSGRSSTAALQGFGVVFGYNRVVIYVEPVGDEITTNTARTNLLIAGRPCPWADWQDEFRANMPKEIIALMEDVASTSEKTDHSDSIRDRLKQVEDLFNLSRYRPSESGTVLVDGETTALSGGQVEGADKHGRKSAGSTGKVAGKVPSAYALFLSDKGVPGQPTKPDVFPRIRWISLAEGTRNQGDLEDRAAKYLKKENLILVNSDFRIFKDMITRWSAQFASTPGASGTVNEVVREWFEQSLVEVVLSANALRGSQHWTDDKIDELLSEEGLTAAVLPRYHIDFSIKRSLGSKLGAVKKSA